MDEWAYEYITAYDILTKRFETQSLKVLVSKTYMGLSRLVILHYLE